MEQRDEEVVTSLKMGEISSTDIQVAINEGNRQGDTFFVVRMGKTGVAMPYQQMIPSEFARYHTKLYLEDITLEGPCGRSWGVAIRPLSNVVRFGKGWRHFSVENNLREGYQLLFKLVGKSRFVVYFFDNAGKGQASFPPLPPMPAFVNPYAGFPRDEENTGEPPSKTVSVAKSPIKFEASVAEPTPKFEIVPGAKPLTRPGTPYTKAPPMDSENAKVILSQYFTKVHPNLCTEASNANLTVKTEDMTEHIVNPSEIINNVGGMEAKHARKKGSYKVETTEEGKAYIRIDSDDDDDDDDDEEEVVKQGTPQLFMRTARKRDPFEETDTLDAGESNLREQTGFHSPEKVCNPRLARKHMHLTPEEQTEYVEQDHFEIHRDGEEDDHFMVSKTCSDSIPLKYSERQRPVGKKTSVQRASWEGKGGHDLNAFAKSDTHGHLRDTYGGKDVAKTSARKYGYSEKARETRHGSIRGRYEETVPRTVTRNHGYREEFRDHTSSRGAFQRGSDMNGHSMTTLSAAKLLLIQQRCMNYSEIVSSCRRRRVTDAERQRALTAATRFAAGLKNESFQVVMTEVQVYHGFKLPIPRDFLEVTGTLKANKVKVCLIDSQKTCYDTKWKWHPGGYAPLLNSDGWALFALDHMLEEGDVCVFELTGPGPAFLFTVHIFKVVENSGRDNVIYELHGQNPGRENSIHELRGGQRAPLNKKFERQAPAASNGDHELTRDIGKKRPIHDLDPPSLQKRTQKPYNLQAWTKLFKPSRVRAHFGGTRVQREF